METQSTFCVPSDDGGMDVHTSTQWIDFTQQAISDALKIPQNSLNMVVRRVGGAYGAKISRGAQVACACALGCQITGRPVRFVLTIESNMTSVGKRFACKNEYTVIVNTLTSGITALTNSFVEDFGCSLNENVELFTLDIFKNCYFPTVAWLNVPGIAKTDAPSATWCRAPGHTEGIAMIENIFEHISRVIGKDPARVRLANISDSNPMKKIYTNFLKDIGECIYIYNTCILDWPLKQNWLNFILSGSRNKTIHITTLQQQKNGNFLDYAPANFPNLT